MTINMCVHFISTRNIWGALGSDYFAYISYIFCNVSYEFPLFLSTTWENNDANYVRSILP